MTGTFITPAQVPGMDMPTASALTPSYVNAFRIAAVTDRLFKHLRSGPQDNSFDVHFFNLCLSLARGIDYAIANNEAPRAPDLPLLLKQVCQRRNDPLLLAAIMVLMISVKSACKNGWFSDKDSEELRNLSNEIANNFCSVRDINTEESSFLPTISTIFLRFYPHMRMGQILAFLEAKPGYGAFVKDFDISKNTKSFPEDKIRLFVAQTDNIETSSCLISPPKVNFLLNGKGVERRINVCMDTGPQIPATVEHMLKYGTNLLQAVGQFNGNYIIVVAFMSVISNPSRPALPDFVQPAVAALDSDSDIIEGPSRISLNCPISFRRINTPVKGHLCKHLQCFDFDNFMDINSRRPSWRCPHCNQCVCFPDICIDQNMVKVLKEVGENAADVIISANGSWKAVTDSDDHTDIPHDRTPIGPVLQDATCFLNAPSDILDLTEGDNEMDVISTCESEDRKLSPANPHNHSNVTNQTSEFNRNIASNVEDDFWAGIYLSPHGIVIYNSGSDNQIIGDASVSALGNPTVLTDAVSPALNQELEVFQRSNLISTSGTQSQVYAPNNMQLQHSGNSNTSNEYGRFPPIVARHVSRTPIAIQALPAQTSASVSGNMERQQQFSRSHLNPLQGSLMTSPLLSQHMGSQNCGNQDRSSISSQRAQQLGSLPAPTQPPSAYLVSQALPTGRLNSHQQQSLNQRIPHSMSPSLVQSSAPHLPRTQGGIQNGAGPMTGPGSSQQALNIDHAQAAQMGRQSLSMPAPLQTSRSSSPSVPVNADASRASVGEQRGNMGVPGQSVPRADSSLDVSAEQNWRPTGRMRGSLSGQAYSNALSQYIIQPTQPVQAARPNITAQPGLPPQLQARMVNSRNAHASQEESHPALDMARGLGFLPAQTSGMH